MAEQLEQAEWELQRGRRAEARGRLRDFMDKVRERSGRERGEHEEEDRGRRDEREAPINSTAYWLLTVNAEYLMRQLVRER